MGTKKHAEIIIFRVFFTRNSLQKHNKKRVKNTYLHTIGSKNNEETMKIMYFLLQNLL